MENWDQKKEKNMSEIERVMVWEKWPTNAIDNCFTKC